MLILRIPSMFISKNIIYIYNRATGISPLFITIAYEDVNSENNISLFSKLGVAPSIHFLNSSTTSLT